MLFLLVGAWIGILGDFIKLWQLREPIMQTARAYYDDWHVWVVVEAKRNGTNKAPRDHLRASYKPESGVFVDIAFGSIATAIIWISLTCASRGIGLELAGQGGMVVGLAGLAAYRILFTAWEIADCKIESGENRAVKVAVGLRGVGLFLLMFLALMLGEGDEPQLTTAENTERFARWIMLAVNGLIVLVGLVTACGPIFLRGETQWLRRYLDERKAVATPTTT